MGIATLDANFLLRRPRRIQNFLPESVETPSNSTNSRNFSLKGYARFYNKDGMLTVKVARDEVTPFFIKEGEKNT